MAGDNRSSNYVYIGNIPNKFKSADLRAFFSQFTESQSFEMFHFRHRPEGELLRIIEASRKNESGSNLAMGSESICDQRNRINVDSADETCCCVTKVYCDCVGDLMRTLCGTPWCDKDGKYDSRKVVMKVIDRNTEEFFSDVKLENLKEMNPPPEMPNGNVGTPLSIFVDLIKSCRLPSSLIKKLGLQFPKSLSKRKYGNVPFEYSDAKRNFGRCPKPKDSNSQVKQYKGDFPLIKKSAVIESRSCNLVKGNRTMLNTCLSKDKESLCRDSNSNNLRCHALRSKSDAVVKHCYILDLHCETGAEDWERHEALHDDVDAQGRVKERLYEEDIELKWEKGGSGLVFYTDAYYWHEMKGKDFDEDTVDDWDVDMSIYSEPGGGDMDAKDLLKMRIAERRAKGLPDGPTDLVGFEKHTKGFGSRQLHKCGWKRGSGLGVLQDGITVPVEAVGQSSRSKTGLGYLGEKLNRHPVQKRRRAERDVVITTIYDERDIEGNVLLSAGPNILRYVEKRVDFVKSKD